MRPRPEDPNTKAAFRELQVKKGASRVALKKTLHTLIMATKGQKTGGNWTRPKANAINPCYLKHVDQINKNK